MWADRARLASSSGVFRAVSLTLIFVAGLTVPVGLLRAEESKQAKTVQQLHFDPPSYTGEKLSVSGSGVDLRDGLTVIANYGRRNLVASDTVVGNLTIELRDVSWDEALDAILRLKGLDRVNVGNVIWILPKGEWAAREKSRLEAEIQLKKLKESAKSAPSSTATEYSGDPITLNFQNVEVRAVLLVIADFTHRNIITSDTVGGNVTVRFSNVRWDEALDVILRSNRLGKRVNGNVIFVAPEEELAAQEKVMLERQIQLNELRVKRERDYSELAVIVLLTHAAFWLLVIALYPRYRLVQAIVLWNRRARQILGLWYVEFLLVSLPFLRRRLFAPFRSVLSADARLGELERHPYFAGSTVTSPQLDGEQPITDAIPEIKGHIVLKGESGLGKTMFLRHLVENSKGVVAYLPAARCRGGVLEAIQDKLLGFTGDADFLRSLIYSGGLDVCIDGLNEVSPDTRAKITNFLEIFSRGNIVIGTQELDWTPPASARVFDLRPLPRAQVAAFLNQQIALIEGPIQNSPQLHKRIDDLVSLVFEGNGDQGAYDDIRRTMSNPMDLTVAAEILARGQYPDVLNLQQQQYTSMAAHYSESYAGQVFPLDRFSECVYEMRIGDEVILKGGDYSKELYCMESFKMVIPYREAGDDDNAKKWTFRHERIADFFLVHSFLGSDNPRPASHLSDSRFRGVYVALATMLPFNDARLLREMLIDYAADTKDHSVSDAFVQILRSRTVQATSSVATDAEARGARGPTGR